MEKYMDSSIFRAAVKGDTKDLKDVEPEELEYLLKTTPDTGNTIVHIAAQHGHSTFIDKALIKFPGLDRQKNTKGNTPLHEAALLGTKDTINVIISCIVSKSADTSSVAYLRDVNFQGDTPFHSALRTRNMAAAEALFAHVKDHPELLVVGNSFGENPLHLYVRYCAGGIFPVNLEHGDNNNAVDEKPELVNEMIIANPLAAFKPDNENMMPLMRAAQYGRVHIIHRILVNHTHVMECRDQYGMNFLHHLNLRLADLNATDKGQTLWICEKILEIPGVDTLTVSCDQHGNTPLHKAILDRDFNLAHLFLLSCVDITYESYIKGTSEKAARSKGRKELILGIKNDKGMTVVDLVTSGSDIPANLKKLMEMVNTGKFIDHGIYNEIQVGDDDEEDINSLIVEGNGFDVMHIALQHGKEKYFEDAIKRNPKVIYQKDSNGDTPLHIAAARIPSDVARKVLKKTLEHWKDNSESVCVPPWRLKNSRGNTLFHEAVRSSNKDTIKMLHELCGPEAMLDINENGETVLHFLAKYCGQKGVDFMIMTKSSIAAYMQDTDGFTPILRAAHCGKIEVVKQFHIDSIASIRISDYNGRTVLHHLCTSVLKDNIGQLESTLKHLGNDSIVMSELMSSQDIDGNTALHVGILNRNYEAVQCFIKHYINAKSSLEMKKLLIHLKNNDGKSVWDIISNGSDIPRVLKNLINQLVSVEATMDDKLYEAASNGDTSVFDKFTFVQLNANTPDGSTIYHIALRHHQFSFAEEALKKFSIIRDEDPNGTVETYFSIIYQEDTKGDTPLHIAARLQSSDNALNFLKLCIRTWSSSKTNNNLKTPPWMVRNSKGDTFLHEAARLGNTNIISLFWALPLDDYDENIVNTDDYETSSFWKSIMINDSTSDRDRWVESALKEYDIADVNDHGETVLHVIARYATYTAMGILERHSEQMKSLVYKRDNEGFTPILRAVQSGRLGMARFLVEQYPTSVELRDYKGRTILHHLRALVMDLADDFKDILPIWKDFFKNSEVDGLRSVQNEDGNTPLHLAIIDADYTKAKFLMEMCLQSNNKQELDIINNDGHSAFDLLSTEAQLLPTKKQLLPLVNRSNVKERESMDNMMDGELYEAAVRGHVEIFGQNMNEGNTEDTVINLGSARGRQNRDEDYFYRLTPGGNNIVHIALKHGSPNVKQFVTTALRCHPILSMQPDNNGDTPLHLAVKFKGSKLGELLVEVSERFLNLLASTQKSFHVAPWAVKNNNGNFPIHEALQTNNLNDALILLECDDEADSRVNDLGETPLHSFAKNGFCIGKSILYSITPGQDRFKPLAIILDSINTMGKRIYHAGDEEAYNFVGALSKRSKRAAYMRDDEGLTPLMYAARSGRFQVLLAILKHHPKSAYLLDSNGKTFLHLLRFTGKASAVDGKQLFSFDEADAQRFVQDYDGNTPLHHAIMTENTTVALLLAQTSSTLKSETNPSKPTTRSANKKGLTILNLLTLHDVPKAIIKWIQKKVPKDKDVYLARRSYDICKTDAKAFANALSVIAALLATVTFAAAFQVPGGSDGNNGSPILLTKPAFVIYVASNTSAMCCSMICLFLLLWVMVIGNNYDSITILSNAINLLLASFGLTLLTFTMGVFVVTAEKSLWLAILVCGLCFLTFFRTLIQKWDSKLVNAVKNFKKFMMRSIR